MNGIGLLVLIAAAGQIGATPQIVPNREFGWQIDQENPDRALCYIVQLSPEKVEAMLKSNTIGVKRLESFSDMPPELVGRATRIVVRIGNDPLPQEPPLEVLRKMPLVNSSAADVTAGLGAGRFSDVDPQDVVTVQQGRTGTPALPTFPNQGTAGLPNATGRATGSTPPMPESWPVSPSTLGSNIGGDRTRDEPSRITDDRYQNQSQNTAGVAGNFTGNSGATPTPGYGPGAYEPNYGSPNPPSLGSEMYTGITPIQTPSPGFGSYPGNQGQGKYNPSTANSNNNSGQGQVTSGQFTPGGQFDQGGQLAPGGMGQGYGDGRYTPGLGGPPGANSGYANNGQGHFGGVSQVASNTSFPSLPPSGELSGQKPIALGGGSATGASTSSSDANKEAAAGSNQSTAFENILPAFFILSLLVNFYLGSLIRKLLTRYRALLANMRGQTTPNALSM